MVIFNVNFLWEKRNKNLHSRITIQDLDEKFTLDTIVFSDDY